MRLYVRVTAIVTLHIILSCCQLSLFIDAQVFQCSGDDMNLVLTGGVTPATSPKVLSPGTLVSPPPPAPAPRLLAQQIAHQNLIARQHEILLASLRPPILPQIIPSYATVRSPTHTTPTYPQLIPQQTLLPTKRTYDRAFTPSDPNPAKRPYTVTPQMPSLSLPMFSYNTTPPIFSYANTMPTLSSYATLPTMPTALPTGYGTALSALPATMSTPFPATLSMFPTYPYYPGV